MVSSNASTVEDYLREVPADRLPALTRVRDLCREELVGFVEVMAYGMPAYERDGSSEIAFASQKHHISIYLMRPDVREQFTERLAQQDMGKGCLRFRRPADLDLDLVRDLLRATARRPGPVC